uniref:Uncharacterized protein n=1 Tax=Anguilla anguilla TaxID=7936 RepID=A0A0E9XEF9_ANGAN
MSIYYDSQGWVCCVLFLYRTIYSHTDIHRKVT